MKLELKHLAAYLPYRLQMSKNGFIGELLTIKSNPFEFSVSCSDWWQNDYKPVLRPLSEITKEIEHNGEKFIPIEKLEEFVPLGKWFGFAIEIDSLGKIGYRTPESWLDPILHINCLNKLFEWHFDVFNLLENGLAVDFNSLTKQ